MSFELNKWHHLPAKWHHVKYRGGKFIYGREWGYQNQHPPEQVCDAIRWALELAKEGRAKVGIEGAGNSLDVGDDIEQIVITFKRVDDAVQFKLMFW